MGLAIEVSDLIFEYSTKRALHGVSIAIQPGTVTALVGPNGAGKSTLMRCIAALETPFAGLVKVSGIDTQLSPREVHQVVGYLPDFYGIYDQLTVEQSLNYMALAHGVPDEQSTAAVERIIEELELTALRARKGGELSRGQRQSLAIAQSLVHSPPVLILDEPAAGLDPQARLHLSKLIRKLKDGGMTIMVSSHILSELEDYSTHMLTMQDGKILAHENIGQDSNVSQRRIVIELATTNPSVLLILNETKGVSQIEAQDLKISLRIDGSKNEQSGLLKHLVERGVPVCSFREEQESMEEVYLSRVRRKDADSKEP